MLDKQTKFAKKAFYATIGAPVVMSRLAKSYGEKAMDLGNKIGDDAVARFDESVKEGRKVTKKLGDQKVVEEIQSKMDLEKVQTQVEKLRDQLEGVLSNWRDSFAPAEKPAVTKPVTTKPAATTTATAKAPAKKAPAKTAAKKAPAKTTAKKAPAKTTAKKAPAKKAPARKPATTSKATTK